ncbi:hypothetical protein CkaCkLH20_05293 [Colletotrichum karsti]|uniref:HNH nuclease domain-containing protein n=1 Tax=Colletotrichum karsti TaxID=1095194 RepID=A0A9P6I779_9PEZI|nr:uncharacterized protein CkaCkLH20_05293 [Colletotrichum karsti]KAF9877027.1 hypothetical protein CkaCkLH20_05293 [Colletotrichum karsti]
MGEQHKKLYDTTWISLKNLRHTPSHDSTFWAEYATTGKRWPEIISMQAHAELLRLLDDDPHNISCSEDWVLGGASDKYQIRYLAHCQISDIAARHARSSRHGDDSESLIRLFMECKDGLGVFLDEFDVEIYGKYDVMFRRMLATYFPEPLRPFRGTSTVWDPVLGERADSNSSPVFHLYPWRQAASMEKIFISGPPVDVFSPQNGLFLRKPIQRGLEHGIIAIIPDVGVDSSSTEFKQRLVRWWQSPVKEYQIVVIDPEHPAAFEPLYLQARRRLLDFEERKLVFNGDFRPDVRCMWWAFLSAVTVAAWRRKGHPTEAGRINSAIRNAMRYWGTPLGLINNNVVSSFMATIAESTENLLDEDQQFMKQYDRDDLGVAVVAFERANAFRDEKENCDYQYEDDDEDMFKYDT